MQQQCQTICLVYGVPGSGKTTLVSQLMADLVIEGDAIELLLNKYTEAEIINDYKNMVHKQSDEEPQQFQSQRWKQSRQLMKQLTIHNIQNQQYPFIVIDDDFLLKSQRKCYRQICQQYGVKYIEILLDTQLNIILARNKLREQHKQLNEQLLICFSNKLETDKLPNQIVITDNKYDIYQIIESIKQIQSNPIDIVLTIDIEQKLKQDKQSNMNIIHQTDLELRKQIGILCKQGAYDPKYLALRKKYFLNSMQLSDDIESNIIEYLKQL